MKQYTNAKETANNILLSSDNWLLVVISQDLLSWPTTVNSRFFTSFACEIWQNGVIWKLVVSVANVNVNRKAMQSINRWSNCVRAHVNVVKRHKVWKLRSNCATELKSLRCPCIEILTGYRPVIPFPPIEAGRNNKTYLSAYWKTYAFCL